MRQRISYVLPQTRHDDDTEKWMEVQGIDIEAYVTNVHRSPTIRKADEQTDGETERQELERQRQRDRGREAERQRQRDRETER